MSSKLEQRTEQEYLALVERIKKQTASTIVETKEQKQKRIQKLLGDWEAFCKYYFGKYMNAEFGWFHKKLFEEVVNDENFFGVAEFPREHAKTVLTNVFMPMFLKAKGELTGVLLGSSNEKKAFGLLSNLQAQLQGNQKYIADFGEQVSFGDWSSGHFKTRDGVGFWAFGRGQSPRGALEEQNRPNFGIIDDIDDKGIVKNPERVQEAVNWVFEDFYGCLAIQKARFIVAGNRIHKNSILANIVGDVNTGDPKRKGLYHLKVYAIENPKTRDKAGFHDGQPAWVERYTVKQLQTKMERMPYRSVRREYFHEHIEDGTIFKPEWIRWRKMDAIQKYDSIATYTDPSFKNSKTSDFKGIVTVGKRGKCYDILWSWVRQASVSSMVIANYDCYDIYGTFSTYWMEANMLQDLLLDDFDEEADVRKFALPLRADKQKKPDKDTRIENMTPLFERGLLFFNEEHRDSPDMQMLVSQFLGFGGGGHDDGPDATEGAISKVNKQTKKSKFKSRTGKFNKKDR